MQLTEKTIQGIMGRWLLSKNRNRYAGAIAFNITTIFAWECDILLLRRRPEILEEFEIKISASDFKSDFKKVYKHRSLTREPKARTERTGPARFWYVMPRSMASEISVPKYAGLILIPENGVEPPTVKIEAPFLHKHTASDKQVKYIASSITWKMIKYHDKIYMGGKSRHEIHG